MWRIMRYVPQVGRQDLRNYVGESWSYFIYTFPIFSSDVVLWLTGLPDGQLASLVAKVTTNY